ncbi:hypothetical protein BUALT_Bualt07G0075100 [Buddleja alternifolia]|uniref:Uncharacterized protein n=1 Tax=Buddleja alternifolia TaxID=168488 RepID=A0AAV6XDF0_9LAMI|nr:hypothetical protein BUALT_Bualt07G0075100 [Buddleja alternifolia]
MFLLLVTLVSLAITVPTTKRNMESKYQELHKIALREEEAVKRTIDIHLIMKYWVMAESSNPQFMIRWSVVCTSSTLICLIAAIVLMIPYILWFLANQRVTHEHPRSVYGNFTLWILVIQCIGVVVGTIAPTFRSFVAISLRCSTSRDYSPPPDALIVVMYSPNFRPDSKVELQGVMPVVAPELLQLSSVVFPYVSPCLDFGSQQVLELLQQRDWPSLDTDKAAYIEERRSLFLQDNQCPAVSTSTSGPDDCYDRLLIACVHHHIL